MHLWIKQPGLPTVKHYVIYLQATQTRERLSYLMSLTSYNGWPASKDQAENGMKSYPGPGSTIIKLRCA